MCPNLRTEAIGNVVCGTGLGREATMLFGMHLGVSMKGPEA